MLSQTHSSTLLGISAIPVNVEANSGERGEPKIILVGLPDAAVKESLDRVQSSLLTGGFSLPRTRVTVNLAPADLKKEGSAFDLPVALCLLASTKQLNLDTMSEFLIAGELALSGQIRPVRGGLSMALLAKEMKLKGVILPQESAVEASIVKGIDIYGVNSLAETVDFLNGKLLIKALQSSAINAASLKHEFACDFNEIKGQHRLKRAVEVAVSGGHNLLIVGPPGSGKSMISKRIPTILPQPSLEEFIEVVRIYSAIGQGSAISTSGKVRPFRSPHHTISDVGLIGGGANPGPGEISLAHNGVLFLDELPEFKRSALEVLRQPLEDGVVTISRSAGKVTLPSQFMFVASMNPCPCGYLGDSKNSCRCSIPQIQRYRAKISGPLLDRIDLHIDAPALEISDIQSSEKGESSDCIRKRVESCREIQRDRFSDLVTKTNASMPDSYIEKVCILNSENMKILLQAMDQLSLSTRAYSRILKVSRTIADMDGCKNIEKHHLLEAIQYRNLDRKLM
jgi:magnesium chelatase family protein